ncbi:MAG TPA: lipid II flippase MurJ, partial [Patescibacteria group bacterium]|nr:lipid II flippase MurJ [Patescibacteria group bacterium]
GIDAYTAAFQIPDFMFYILVSGALSVTFIPVFVQRLGSGNKRSAWALSASMINFLAPLTMIASIVIIIFAPWLVDYVVAPGMDEAGRALATSMMRVIAVNPFLFAIATVIASIQQALGRYLFYALAPMIYNIGIIIGALSFTNGITIFGWHIFEGGIMGVALGVVLGSIMQLLVSAIGLVGLGFDYEFKISWKNKGFRTVLSLLPARSLDQGMDYLNSIVETNLASRLGEGVVRAYQQVTALHLMPINLVGVAISTAAFPSMSENLGSGRIDRYRKELQQVVRVIIWLALPIATITYFGRGYLVSFIKNGGDQLMATLLGTLVIAMLFRTVYHIAARSFYAQQDTKTPLYISLFSIGLNIALAIWFTMSLKMGPVGLAFAQSIVAVVEVVILFVVIHKRLEGGFVDAPMIHAVGRMLSATGFTALVAYGMVQLLQFQSTDLSLKTTVPKFVVITIVSFAVYLGVCRLMRLEETYPVIARIEKVVFGGVRR